ncbi:XIAP-associated factor 1 [Silurus meridionalis]|nr:XIAP-associated factor 1 [Silurus meridionalis]
MNVDTRGPLDQRQGVFITGEKSNKGLPAERQNDEIHFCTFNKEVVKTNLPVHEAHCQRFLCLCPDCDDQVPKDQLEEHRKERHTVIKCKKCNMKMENCKLADHEANECTKRLESCEYCQMDLPWSDLKEHTVACGSRTELCPDCKKYVRLKDQLQHANICSSEEDFSFKHNKNVKPLPVNTLQDDQVRFSLYHISLLDYIYIMILKSALYTQLDKDLPEDWRDHLDIRGAESEPEDTVLSLSDLQKKKRNEKKGWVDENQTSTCPYCHLILPIRTLQWHEKGMFVKGPRVKSQKALK